MIQTSWSCLKKHVTLTCLVSKNNIYHNKQQYIIRTQVLTGNLGPHNLASAVWYVYACILHTSTYACMLMMCCFMFLFIDLARNELPYASRGSEHTSAREDARKNKHILWWKSPHQITDIFTTCQTADAQGHCTVQCVSPQLCQELGPENAGPSGVGS